MKHLILFSEHLVHILFSELLRMHLKLRQRMRSLVWLKPRQILQTQTMLQTMPLLHQLLQQLQQKKPQVFGLPALQIFRTADSSPLKIAREHRHR